MDARRPLIAVAGSGDIGPDDPRWALALDLGEALVDAGYRILCGGRGGVSTAVGLGARRSGAVTGSDVVGVVPSDDPRTANAGVDIALSTGLGQLRNGLVAHGEALVAIGGGAGTLSEMALAWIYDRVVIAYKTDGWSGTLADTRVDDRTRFGDGRDDRVYGVDSAVDVIVLLDRWVRE